jgi:hypothetical protein
MPTQKKTDVSPLAQRDVLFDQLATVELRQDEYNAKRHELTAAAQKAEADLAETRVQFVTDEVTSTDVAKATTAREKANAAVTELAPELAAIDTARRRVERQLLALHIRNRAAFEREAEEVSAAAEEALAQLVPHLRTAATAWAEAAGAWTRVNSWIDHVDAPLNDEPLGRVPDFPLTLALNARTRPRPFERNAEGDADLLPTQIAVFKDERKGVEVKAIVGSTLWREYIAAARRFTLVRTEEPNNG